MTPETAIKRKICSYLVSKGIGIFVHDSVGIYDVARQRFRSNRDPYRIRGVSDLLGILPNGRFLAIEVKVKGKYPSKEQKEFIEWIRSLNGIAFVARSVEDVERELGGVSWGMIGDTSVPST